MYPIVFTFWLANITSHEMRNPLSAILQCSDEITSALTQFQALEEQAQSGQKLSDVLESSIDAAQTIALCAQHQVRVLADAAELSLIDW